MKGFWINNHQSSNQPGIKKDGQALVEFVMVLPVLILLILAAYYIGTAMYGGANAASAMKEPILKKEELADTPGSAVTLAQGWIQNYQSGSFSLTGPAVDTVSVQYPNNVSSILVGTKSMSLPLAALPDFNFTTPQAINSNLLKANTAPISQAQSANTNINVNPADYGLDPATIPPTIPMASPTCATGAVPDLTAKQVNTLLDPTGQDMPSYQLSMFSPPATQPARPFNPNPTIPMAVDTSKLLTIRSLNCQDSASTANWQKECNNDPKAQVSPANTTCVLKKAAACNLEYASMYANDVIKAFAQSTGCGNNTGAISTDTSDVIFPASGMPQY